MLLLAGLGSATHNAFAKAKLRFGTGFCWRFLINQASQHLLPVKASDIGQQPVVAHQKNRTAFHVLVRHQRFQRVLEKLRFIEIVDRQFRQFRESRQRIQQIDDVPVELKREFGNRVIGHEITAP